jgi:uncharacterized membrane protein YkvA (DUF1232 family)
MINETRSSSFSSDEFSIGTSLSTLQAKQSKTNVFSGRRVSALIRGMAKTKTKSRPRKTPPLAKKVTRPVSRPKAALRSEAFARALADAKSHANDPALLRALFEEAASKAAAIPKEPFADSWPYVQTMLRLLRAYFRGEYRNVSQDDLFWVITAMNYFVDPFDLIPDEVPFLGFVDDATVMAFAVGRTRQTLDDFMTWETTAF